MSNKSIQLTRSELTQELRDNQHLWVLRVEAAGQGGASSDIFVYQKGEDVDSDLFVAVASASQIADFSTEREEAETFYRKSLLEFFCLSQYEVENLWQDVQTDVAHLLKNLRAADNLSSSEVVTVETTGTFISSGPPSQILHTLSIHPEGSPVLNDGVQEIATDNPDLDLYYNQLITEYPAVRFPQNSPADTPYAEGGWLPVEFLPARFTAPTGARFWYNVAYYPKLQREFPLRSPVDVHQLRLNGTILPYGQVYVIDGNTIYWLDFDPEDVPGWPKIGNAPWALDYVDRSSAGTPMSLQLLIYR